MAGSTYTVSNIAGGDRRRFRSDRYGRPSDASIRHARRQGAMGFACSDPDIHERILRAMRDREDMDEAGR